MGRRGHTPHLFPQVDGAGLGPALGDGPTHTVTHCAATLRGGLGQTVPSAEERLGGPAGTSNVHDTPTRSRPALALHGPNPTQSSRRIVQRMNQGSFRGPVFGPCQYMERKRVTRTYSIADHGAAVCQCAPTWLSMLVGGEQIATAFCLLPDNNGRLAPTQATKGSGRTKATGESRRQEAGPCRHSTELLLGSWHLLQVPTASLLGRHLSQLNSSYCFTLERQPQPSPSSPVTDVTAVPGAALLIFNVDFTAAELQARRAGGGHAESPQGCEDGTDGKGLHKPESPSHMCNTLTHFSPWLNSERARAACACSGTRRMLTEPEQ
ncbi:hypothetical protein HPG69_019125 [Diceros bicornis minor]|uniref:Uncharacterized protein n=1 Tax=Diceros bicornis minor TaxID=77932 RepID=A0A7J7FM31_DICBM|nr:hypothetical protein HPG69_019125 [Diceros bicornis minor]